MIDYIEYYKNFYSRYSQRMLREEKKKNEATIKYIQSQIKKYTPKPGRLGMSTTGSGILNGYLKDYYRELKECEIKNEVLEKMIKSKVINWKACFAMCAVCFVLYNGVKAEMKSADNEKIQTIGMHGLEEDGSIFNSNSEDEIIYDGATDNFNDKTLGEIGDDIVNGFLNFLEGDGFENPVPTEQVR